jgi:hypothetical protein
MRILCLVLALVAAAAHAQRPLYRSVGPDGRVTYSDQPSADAESVKQWTPVSQDSYAYDGGVVRAERDALYYDRQRNEDRQARPIVTYDPRGWTAQRLPSARPGTRWYDPNLPPSQPPSLERRYYYDGR